MERVLLISLPTDGVFFFRFCFGTISANSM